MLDDFFRTLVALGTRPNVIVDVGAHRGEWTRTSLRHFPDAQYVLFEPQRDLMDAQADLVSPRIRIHHDGVGPAPEDARPFTMHPDRGSWSFAYSSEDAVEFGLSQSAARIVTLDQYFATGDGRDLAAPDILKIDAEGWDLQVLAGAGRTVAAADIVFVEAGVTNKLFVNSAIAVMTELDGRGFSLIDITDAQRPLASGALWNVELAFANRSGRTWAALGTRDKQLRWALDELGR